MYLYGALVDHKDAEARADIDAMLDGREPPSVARERAEKHQRLLEFAHMGEVAGADR